jgi:hypothetical protein
VDPPEAAVGVLRHVHRLCEPGGLLLDLTCMPPAASIEVDGEVLGRLDQRTFLANAQQTEDAVDLLIGEGLLVEEAAMRHEVLKHFDDGADVIADVDGRRVSRMPPDLRAQLAPVRAPVVERTTCLLRRLRVLLGGS